MSIHPDTGDHTIAAQQTVTTVVSSTRTTSLENLLLFASKWMMKMKKNLKMKKNSKRLR